MSKIRKLTLGASPKDPHAFHYSVGSNVTFYTEDRKVYGRVVSIVHRGDLFAKHQIEQYDIYVETPNQADPEVMDKLLWKELKVGSKDSRLIENDLDY